MFKIGDKVKIIDLGKIYRHYESWFDDNCPSLRFFYTNDYPNDYDTYILVFKHLHRRGNKMLCAIKDKFNKVYLIEERGLEQLDDFYLNDKVRIVNKDLILPFSIDWFDKYAATNYDVKYYSYGNYNPDIELTYTIIGKGKIEEVMVYEIQASTRQPIFLVTKDAIEAEGE